MDFRLLLPPELPGEAPAVTPKLLLARRLESRRSLRIAGKPLELPQTDIERLFRRGCGIDDVCGGGEPGGLVADQLSGDPLLLGGASVKEDFLGVLPACISLGSVVHLDFSWVDERSRDASMSLMIELTFRIASSAPMPSFTLQKCRQRKQF